MNPIQLPARKIYCLLPAGKTSNTDIERAISHGMLPKSALIDGKQYIGHCRNSHIAKWVAAKNHFEYTRVKFDMPYTDTIPHPEDDKGFDIFVPTHLAE